MSEAVLGVDCSGDLCSVALALGADGPVYEAEVTKPGEQLTLLLPLALKLLRQHGVAADSLWRLGVAVGPGSFTGLRLAITTVRTMAQVLRKPVVPVTTLQAIAWALEEWAQRRPARLAVLTDARKGQIFAAAFDSGVEAESQRPCLALRGSPQALEPVAAGDWLAALQDDGASLLVGGSAFARFADVLAPRLGPQATLAPLPVALPRARFVARAAAGAFGRVEPVDYAGVTPFYLRAPDVRPPRRLPRPLA